MEEQKFQINLENGIKELVIREGEAPEKLPEKAPIPVSLYGNIDSVARFLEKRVELINIDNAHIIVNREQVSITLIINESDAYKRGTIGGKLQVHPAFEAFGINNNKIWTPNELGMFCKMNRSFFADRSENMKLVATLMNFTATINNKLDKQLQENGSHADSFSQVVNSNLPEKFTVKLPIFKGFSADSIEVETFAQVDGRQVQFVLLSPGAKETIEELRDKVIDEQIASIKEIAPKIVIIDE